MRTKSVGVLVLALLVPAAGVLAQELPLKVKGGHQIGETSEQFFAEGREKDILGSCSAGDYKNVIAADKKLAKKYCTELTSARDQAVGGKRCAYQTAGDPTELRSDTYTFDSGHLVRVDLIYATPSAEDNYRGQKFDEIFSGVKQAYGPPTDESTTPASDAYGVPYVAHREIWVSPSAAILIVEKPGPGGFTTLTAFTRAEYDRTKAAGAVKPANPLE